MDSTVSSCALSAPDKDNDTNTIERMDWAKLFNGHSPAVGMERRVYHSGRIRTPSKLFLLLPSDPARFRQQSHAMHQVLQRDDAHQPLLIDNRNQREPL